MAEEVGKLSESTARSSSEVANVIADVELKELSEELDGNIKHFKL